MKKELTESKWGYVNGATESLLYQRNVWRTYNNYGFSIFAGKEPESWLIRLYPQLQILNYGGKLFEAQEIFDFTIAYNREKELIEDIVKAGIWAHESFKRTVSEKGRLTPLGELNLIFDEQIFRQIVSHALHPF